MQLQFVDDWQNQALDFTRTGDRRRFQFSVPRYSIPLPRGNAAGAVAAPSCSGKGAPSFMLASNPGTGQSLSSETLSTAPATLVSPHSRWAKAAAEAMEQVFHKKTVYMRCGGSVPIVDQFEQYLGIPSVMMGFGLPDDNLHAPNEKFHLPNFYRGIEAVGRYFELLGQ